MSQNSIERYKHINEGGPEIMEVVRFTKTEYINTVKEERKQRVHQHFGRVLEELFQVLRDEAHNMRVCHHEVTFECPDMFDVDKTEAMLVEYFRDISYDVIVTARNPETISITLTLT